MPDLRVTPERREQIERRIQRSLLSLADPDEGSPTPEWPDVYAEDALDLLHDLDVLERQRDEARREVERFRERLDALAAHFDAEASFAYDGWQEEKDDYLEGVYRAFRHAAEKVRDLATERGGDCG